MTTATEVNIHDVWRSNMEDEFAKIRELIKDYPYVAMDTEFPGIVATPLGTFRNKEDFHYQMLFCNVNMLKLIQVGFVLVNDKGELPPTGDVWQFNFQFSLNDDVYAQESVEMLRTAGIDFTRMQTDGISMDDFGELLTTSGLIVDDRITWLTFSSGYDFGYLLKAITLAELPKEEGQFFQFHRALFPRSYDVKALLKLPQCASAKLKGGLQEIADQLDVKRIGANHTAGSDALLTARTFFKIKHQFFADSWDKTSALILGQMHGLGSSLAGSLSNRPVDDLIKDDSSMPSNSTRKHTISNKTRKRPGKDYDQLHEDLKPHKAKKLLNQEVDLDLPGDGQFYCIECERYFIDSKVLNLHKKTKLHKNRVKTLKEVPYTIKESEAAGGVGHYPHVTKKSRVERETEMETDDVKTEIKEENKA